MANNGNYVFGKHEEFNLEQGTPLSSVEGKVFKIKRSDIYYSEKYECPMLVLETSDGKLHYSMSEIVTDRFVKAVNLGFKTKGAVVVLRAVEGANGVYHRLEQPTPEELKAYNQEQFEKNVKKD